MQCVADSMRETAAKLIHGALGTPARPLSAGACREPCSLYRLSLLLLQRCESGEVLDELTHAVDLRLYEARLRQQSCP